MQHGLLTGVKLEIRQNPTEFEHEEFSQSSQMSKLFSKRDLQTAIGTGLWFFSKNSIRVARLRQKICAMDLPWSLFLLP